MKYFLILISFILLSHCAPQSSAPKPSESASMKPEKNDDGEWDLIVIDSQYDYFLKSMAKSINLYSENQLKARNAILVNEWNSYFFSGRYRNVIESSIDYDPQENYGLKFEYKLYQVFAYVQWKYGLRMNGLSASDIR